MGGLYPGGGFFGQYSLGGAIPASGPAEADWVILVGAYVGTIRVRVTVDTMAVRPTIGTAQARADIGAIDIRPDVDIVEV